MNFRDTKLPPIWEKIRHGERLSLEDGLALYRTDDLISVGKMANFVQQQNFVEPLFTSFIIPGQVIGPRRELRPAPTGIDVHRRPREGV